MSYKTKERIFRAAARIIREKKVDDLTLEEVASEAELSKGGLLYHFPTKDALIQGLIDHYEELFGEELKNEMEKLPDGDKKPLTAYINALFNFQSASHELSQGVLAATLLNPNLLAPVQQRLATFTLKHSKHLKDEYEADIIRLAADGLWLEEILELNSISDDKRARIKDKLKGMAKEVEADDGLYD